MDPVGLAELLNKLPQTNDPNLLVGYGTKDDAGIYRLTDEIALVTTADFITPPVNDPFLYGQIAAANALGDVYAMGGRPVTCLNLVCFPSEKLPPHDLQQIVAGALQIITEAGAVLAGGHSVEDDEPKFGLAVTGIVHPQKYWSNAGAKEGDALILTKAIGSGVLFNANLKKWVSPAAMQACTETLVMLNKNATEIMGAFDIHAATDITGFGLAGHALEMAEGSSQCLEIEIKSLPIMDEALEMYRKGMNTGVNAHNRQLVSEHTRIAVELPKWHEEILFDPQTSGGLMVSLPQNQAQDLLDALLDKGLTQSRIIGKVKRIEKGIHLVFK